MYKKLLYFITKFILSHGVISLQLNFFMFRAEKSGKEIQGRSCHFRPVDRKV